MGVVAMVLFHALLLLRIALAAIGELSASQSVLVWLVSGIEGIMNIGVLALGLSLAALLSRRGKRGWAIGGVVASVLVLVACVVFLLV